MNAHPSTNAPPLDRCTQRCRRRHRWWGCRLPTMRFDVEECIQRCVAAKPPIESNGPTEALPQASAVGGEGLDGRAGS
jgi:hypothetical protein